MPIPLARLNAAQWSRHSCLQFNKLVNTGRFVAETRGFLVKWANCRRSLQKAHGPALPNERFGRLLALFRKGPCKQDVAG